MVNASKSRYNMRYTQKRIVVVSLFLSICVRQYQNPIPTIALLVRSMAGRQSHWYVTATMVVEIIAHTPTTGSHGGVTWMVTAAAAE